MAIRYGNPVTQYLDDSGSPLVSGKLTFFATGTNTLLDTFVDINLSIPNTNPVILTAAGRLPNVFLQSASYKVILTDKDDVQIFERDPVGGELESGAFAIWNSLTIYSTNDIVEADTGDFYISIIENNVGNEPATSPAQWTQIKFVRVWNPNETYSTDDLVQASNGRLFVSAGNNNTNNDPTVDDISWNSATTLDIPSVITASALTFAFENF